LPHPKFLSQPAQFPRSHRLGHDQPPERPRPTPQQPLIKRQPRPAISPPAAPVTPLTVPREQPVANPADHPPAPNLRDKPGKPASRQRPPPRPRGQRQQHLRRLVIHTADKRVPRSDNPDGSARSGPHPPKRDRSSPPPGSNPRVIGRHQRRKPLSLSGVSH